MLAKQNNSEAAGDLSDIKRKLIWRMGVAGLMIVALLGGLALFDHLASRPEEETPAPQFSHYLPAFSFINALILRGKPNKLMKPSASD